MTVPRTRNYPHGVRVAVCAFRGCGRRRYRAQLCEAHFLRLERGASIATPIRAWTPRPKRARRCAVYGCDRVPGSDYVCVVHANQNPTKGTL